jgi:two-component system OmpR family sensor kinase
MTIAKKLYKAFGLILAIIIFIVGVFFYSIINLNNIHLLQNHRYEQIRRVEKIKEFNNSFAWIVLDIIVDRDKKNIVRDRLNKANRLFKELLDNKSDVLVNSETEIEKEKLEEIFSQFNTIQTLITKELIILVQNNSNQIILTKFHDKFDTISNKTKDLLIEEILLLQNKLHQTEDEKEKFISKIKLELIVLLFISFSLSFIISSKLINDIRSMIKKLNNGVLQLLDNSEKSIKVDIGSGNELSEITNNLNSYLQQKDDIIKSREELLRNISHELKTPITKGKFLLEKLKEINSDESIENINDVFYDIEELTSKLLQREKLNFATLNLSKFKVTTLILEALSKLSIDDESKVEIDIGNDFSIQGDYYYLTIVIKNLIDNAMKYSDSFPIKIETTDKKLSIQNNAKELTNGLIYYIQPFTREPNQQHGHGLGLNIVNKILQLHNLSLDYEYKNSSNIFSVSFE